MKRKLQEPFKDSYVPDSAMVALMIKYRQLFHFLYATQKELIGMPIGPRYHRKYHEWKKSIPYREAKELLMHEFNYEKSTIATGDVISRCMRLFEKYLSHPK